MNGLRNHTRSITALLFTVLTLILALSVSGTAPAGAQSTENPLDFTTTGTGSANLAATICGTPVQQSQAGYTFYVDYVLSSMCINGISVADPLSTISFIQPLPGGGTGIYKTLAGSQVSSLLYGPNYTIAVPVQSGWGLASYLGTWTLKLTTQSGIVYNINYTLALKPAGSGAPAIGAYCAGGVANVSLAGFSAGQTVTVALIEPPASIDPVVNHTTTVETNISSIKTVTYVLTRIDTLQLTVNANGMLFYGVGGYSKLSSGHAYYFGVLNNGNWPSGRFEGNPAIARLPICS